MAESDDNNTLYKGGGVNRVRRIFPDDDLVTVERPLWDSIAQEPARLAGSPVRVYSLRRAKNRHPLYGEPSVGGGEWQYAGPWEMMALLEYEQEDAIDSQAESEGLDYMAQPVVWIARKEFEDVQAPDPKVGDIIDFWELGEFDVQTYNNPQRFRFWDVIQANPGGNVFNSDAFVMWRIEVKGRTRFDPRRKVEGDSV